MTAGMVVILGSVDPIDLCASILYVSQGLTWMCLCRYPCQWLPDDDVLLLACLLYCMRSVRLSWLGLALLPLLSRGGMSAYFAHDQGQSCVLLLSQEGVHDSGSLVDP